MRIWWLAVLWIGCTNLERIEPDGTCGNRIVEPQAGEDCDGAAPSGHACGAQGVTGEAEPGACRFVCSDTRCPPGWLCGKDGVCRVPKGTFETRALAVRGVPVNAIAANLDGDEYDDLIVLTESDVHVYYGDPAADFEEAETFGVDNPFGDLEAGDFNGDRLADLAIEQLAGPLFLRGREDRVLEQIARPAFARTIDSDQSLSGAPQARFLSVITESFSGMRTPVLLQNRKSEISLEVPFDYLARSLPPLGLLGSEGPLPPAIAVGEIDSSTVSLDEIALGLEATRRVIIFNVACRAPLSPIWDLSCTTEVRTTVETLQPIFGGTFFGDVNGDGHQDLIVHVVEGFEVAFGDGAGDFSASAPLRIEVEGAPLFSVPTYVGETGYTPRLDFVFSEGPVGPSGGRTIVFGVRMRTASSGYVLEAVSSFVIFGLDSWADVDTGDFNRDGYLDVVGVRYGAPGLDILLGTGTPLFNPFNVRFDQSVLRIAVGDFDGDFHDDVVAYDRRGDLSVVFGSPQGPGEQVFMVRSATVVDLVPVDSISASGIDLITDLVVMTDATTGAMPSYAITLLLGSSRRQMLAPLSFIVDGRAQQQIVLDAVIGRFSEDERADVIIVTSTGADAPQEALISLWILEGDESNSELPVPLEFVSCPISPSCIQPQPPFVANFDSDPAQEVLMVGRCPLDSVWIADVDATAAATSCRRANAIDQAIQGYKALVPVDVELDGTYEIAIYGTFATKLARTSDGTSWTIEDVVFPGEDPPRALTPLRGGGPGATIAFVSAGGIYAGSLEAGLLQGTRIADYPFGRSYNEGAPGDGGDAGDVNLIDRGGLLAIDARGDGIPDLVVFGEMLLLQEECRASDEGCVRPEVVE